MFSFSLSTVSICLSIKFMMDRSDSGLFILSMKTSGVRRCPVMILPSLVDASLRLEGITPGVNGNFTQNTYIALYGLNSIFMASILVKPAIKDHVTIINIMRPNEFIWSPLTLSMHFACLNNTLKRRFYGTMSNASASWLFGW